MLGSQEIDTYIVQAKERGYQAMVRFGKRGLNLAATAAVQAATKVPAVGQDALSPPPRGAFTPDWAEMLCLNFRKFQAGEGPAPGEE